MHINEILNNIQSRLVAKKDKWNDFSSYNYRSAESILEALKPLLIEYKCSVMLNDDMVEVGNRVYVKATAILTDATGASVSASAFAREAVSRKGMDDSQLTGATSSYARKYALGGLFAIDDSADSDRLNNNKDYLQPAPVQKPALSDDRLTGAIAAIKDDSKSDWTMQRVIDDFSLTAKQLEHLKKEVSNDSAVQ